MNVASEEQDYDDEEVSINEDYADEEGEDEEQVDDGEVEDYEQDEEVDPASIPLPETPLPVSGRSCSSDVD
jgi:hypothetical protein